jgi:Ca-activated chloride channel family protein
MKRVYIQQLQHTAALLPKLIAVFFSLLFFIACILNYSKTFGQGTVSNCEIRGKVVDEKGKAMISASVVILDTNGKSTGRGVKTDFDGNYRLSYLKPGEYNLLFSYVGYSAQVIKGIIVVKDKPTIQNVHLEPKVSGPQEVMVMVYKKPLISMSDTKIEQTITGDDIRNSGTISIENTVARAAGVTNLNYALGNNKRSININGSRPDEVQYIVNGHRQMGTPVNIDAEAADMEPAPLLLAIPAQPKPDSTGTAEYKRIEESEFKSAAGSPLSTFSIDVDAASYSIMRRMITAGLMPPAAALRSEEMINYFPYQYEAPKDKTPFAVHTELADCPWNEGHQLLKIGIQGRIVSEKDMPPANLVFLVDVSGSMMSEERLPLVQYALGLLTDKMRPQDRISLVAYAGNAGLVLASTPGSDKDKIKAAINGLEAGGSTAGGAGIQLAYEVAKENFIKDGNNRIILCTDGDFNVGVSSDGDLEKLITEERKSGVFLSAIGVGTDNYKDTKMEILADKGNGNYSYLDGRDEAKKVMVKQMGGTVLTIAKDVKIQTVFNPSIVKSYRLIGYEDRKLEARDFSNDHVDAGEIGAGAAVTALYELVLGETKDSANVPLDEKAKMHLSASDLMAVRVRYKAPDGDTSTLIEQTVGTESKPLHRTSEDFRWASAVAAYTMLLRGSQYKGDFTYDKVIAQAKGALGRDKEGYRSEFIDLVKAADKLSQSLASTK